jgi:acetoin utilization deacetylase AcuC-like enzyme
MIALVHSKEYENHNTGIHPENKERIRVIMDSLENEGLLNFINSNDPYYKNHKLEGKIDVFEPEIALREDILRVHKEYYVDYLKTFCSSGGGNLDLDTVVSEESYKIAKLAAGGAITASKLVLNGYNSAYSLARPPGHHATREKAMGFCLLNNLAVAIEHLKEFYGIKKFMIFDFDAHYGNGNAEIYLNDPNVLYISIHQDPFTIFPGSGFIEEIGKGDGEGYNMNIPMPPGSTSEDYIYILNQLLEPIAHDFGAEFYFLEVGFDAHKDDPLSRLHLDDEFYPWIASQMMEITDKMVLILEGGYNLAALSRCNIKMINVLKNELTNDDIVKYNHLNNLNISNDTKKIFHNIKDIFSSFYEF